MRGGARRFKGAGHSGIIIIYGIESLCEAGSGASEVARPGQGRWALAV